LKGFIRTHRINITYKEDELEDAKRLENAKRKKRKSSLYDPVANLLVNKNMISEN